MLELLGDGASDSISDHRPRFEHVPGQAIVHTLCENIADALVDKFKGRQIFGVGVFTEPALGYAGGIEHLNCAARQGVPGTARAASSGTTSAVLALRRFGSNARRIKIRGVSGRRRLPNVIRSGASFIHSRPVGRIRTNRAE